MSEIHSLNEPQATPSRHSQREVQIARCTALKVASQLLENTAGIDLQRGEEVTALAEELAVWILR